MAHPIVQPTPAPSRVLVTGANGFVGSVLCRGLAEAGHAPRAAVRQIIPGSLGPDTAVCVGDIDGNTDWSQALRGIDCVVHLAARTHVMRDTAANPLGEYRLINVAATRRLAEQAVAAGVQRFIFASSIKVNGERTADKPVSEQDEPHPEDAYGVSKWEAEQALRAAADSSMETVVLRLPLLYGPGVKGNFLSLLRAIDRGWPLPFAAVHNRRSLLYVGNLVDAIILCLDHPAAGGKTYLLADDDGISTPDLVRGIARALGKPARLFPFPPVLLKIAGAVAANSGAVSRLLGSLLVDSGKIRGELGWRPRCDMARGLEDTARWYLHSNG